MEHSLALVFGKKYLKLNSIINALFRNSSDGDLELLKSELNLRVEEVDRQRAEMAAMADRYNLFQILDS